jgi:hypothetical protein
MANKSWIQSKQYKSNNLFQRQFILNSWNIGIYKKIKGSSTLNEIKQLAYHVLKKITKIE